MTSPRLLAVLLATATAFAATTARADDLTLEAPAVFWEPVPPLSGMPERSPVAPDPWSPSSLRWYGWQTLALDASSALLLAAAAGTESGLSGLLAVGGHLAGPPILHFVAHDSNGRAIASLVLRALLPVVGFLLGAGAECNDRVWFCIPQEAWVGYGVGMLTASALDAVIVSWQ